jgi:hypothetical protein
MNELVDKAQVAWQPLTIRGVAAFSRASLGRLLLVQFIVAILAAASVVWALQWAWYPTIGEAIRQLPVQGELRSGKLDWPDRTPKRLAEGRCLALVVDLDHSGQARSPAQVQVEFGRTDIMASSVLGYMQRPYPRDWTVAFNRTKLGPWWGAWAPAILGIVAVLTIGTLLLLWAVLAAVYALPAWLVGFFANRELSLFGSWRLASAALMPGALFFTAAIVLYGWGALDLVRLAGIAVLHFLIGWVYLVLSPWRVPRRSLATTKENPFA